MDMKEFIGRKVRVTLENGGGCHFGKITSVAPGLFGESEVVLVEVDGGLKAVSPEAVEPLKKDIKKNRNKNKQSRT